MNGELAIDGGTPIRTEPLPSWPAPGDEECAAVDAVLRSGDINYWTGDRGREFERRYARATQTKGAIAVANGTLALELALRAFGVGAGDEVVVPARSFIASASCAVAVGAVPVIADIDPVSGALTADTIEAVLTERSRAVIVVHLGGHPADMDPIMDLARDRGLVVVEDCAQAHGGFYKGRPVGSIGDAGCFSFCQDKIIPTGEGGMVVLSDKDAFVRAWEYKDHGKSIEKLSHPVPDDGSSYRWLHDSFGTNMRLGEMEAALGLVGLDKLPRWHTRRARNARRLAAGLADVPGIEVFLSPEYGTHAYYRLYGRIDIDSLAEGWTRDRVLAAIRSEGVAVQYGSCAELYREQAFVCAGLAPAGRLTGASRAHEESIAFFVHPTLEDEDIDDVIAATAKVLSRAVVR